MQLHKGHTVIERISQKQESYKVLVVDDNPGVLSVLKDILAAQGFEMHTASNARDALGSLESSAPDIIVCDVMMPDMDGFELHDVVRKNSEWCNIPFIFLTALSSKQEIMYGKQHGCDDYLVKPFEPQELISVIEGKLKVSEKRNSLNKEALDGYRKRIINTLSHEFRTPLVAINTGSELLLDSKHPLGDERTRRLLESIHRGGQRLQRLVNDFMTLQQVDSGSAINAAKALRRKISLLEIVENAVELFQDQHMITNPVISLKNDFAEAEHCDDVKVYDTQVTDMIERLLSNAYKFGGSESQIEITVSSNGKESFVSVRDHGPGMSAEIAKQACSGFSQINRDTLEQQGCGLGLTIACYFADINEGKVDFKNPEDGGTEVVVRFPCAS